MEQSTQLTALQHLESLALAAHSHKHTDIKTALLPSGATVVSLEKFMAHPERTRAIYTTSHPSDLQRYLITYGTELTALFIDIAKLEACAIIDYGTPVLPAWGNHRALLKLQRTPEYNALLKVCSIRQTQRELIEWLEDWATTISLFHDETQLALGPAIHAIRKLDVKKINNIVQKDDDFHRSISAMESIELQQSDSQPTPTHIVWHGSLFEDTAPRTLRVRIGLQTGDEKPAFSLRIVEHDWHIAQIADELKEQFTSQEFTVAFQIFNGTITINQQ